MYNKQKPGISFSYEKKMSARERRSYQEAKEYVNRLMSDPDTYYKFHNNYGLFLYLTQIITKVAMDMRGVAPVIFNKQNASYKDLVKTINSYDDTLKACNKACETIRKDKMLFTDPNSELGEMQYEAAHKDSIKILNLLNLIMGILDASNWEDYVKIEAALKLLYKPEMEKYNKLVTANNVLKNYEKSFSEENVKIWSEYIKSNK